jgi:tRNA(Ile)-lysidine synthase
MLLNLLRGSGPLGLAGMPALRRLGEGNLARPLLSVSRAELADYALRHALAWTEDPANDDPGMDRNFLRHRVLPTLADRWPDANRRLARSAMHASDAQALLEDLASADLATVTDGDPARIRIEGMTAMSLRRQRNLIRGACSLAGLPRPPAQRLETLLNTLPAAAPDAEPRVVWPGAEARRYRGELFLLPQSIADGTAITGSLAVDRPVDLGPQFGRLTLRQSEGAGIPSDLARRGLKLATRQGGECIRVSAGGRSQKLKKLLQQDGVLPWMRDLLPLALDGDRLVAVADRWINADIATTPGYRVVWTDGPAVV